MQVLTSLATFDFGVREMSSTEDSVKASASFDPILVEVMKNELTAIAEEMGITMKRTARSLVAKEGGDFSTALTDANGALIAQGLTIGIHLGYIAGVMPSLLKRFGASLRPGDVIASNDPYGGLSHLPDIVLVMPVFWREQLVAFSTIVAHHTDIGGRFPGGMGAASENLFQEGIRLPGVKLFDAGVRNDALVDVLAANVRAPGDVVGDLEAQAAACRRGADGITRILDTHGLRTFEAINAQLRTYSERAMRATLARIPDGCYACEDWFEDDGLGGEGVAIALQLVVAGDQVTVDFAGTGAQLGSAMNVPINLTKACVYVALRSILDTDAPANAGLTAPIDVKVPLGCVLNPAFPGAVGARGMLMWRIIDMVFAALAQADPRRVYAAGEGGMNLLVFTPERVDAGHSMLVDIYAGGWGARATLDGVEGVTPMAAGGATRSLPAEMIERECPIMLEGFGFVADTGGAGEFRGSLSVFRRWRFLERGQAMLRNCRVRSVPYGLCDGEDGTPFAATLIDAKSEHELPAQMMIDRTVTPGQSLLHVQPGGGGYGSPLARDPARVLDDVLDEKISSSYASRVYGVVLNDAQTSVDVEATKVARACAPLEGRASTLALDKSHTVEPMGDTARL